jgi:hypothetical protein
MGRGSFNVLIAIVVFVMFSLSGCGGGGAASTPTQNANAISTATFSGKSFAVIGGTMTFNADGTLSGVGVNTTNETWTVNASGQLVISGSSKGTGTCTLTGDATHGWTGNMVYSGGTTATLTLAPTTATAGFTNSMISGKSFSTGSGIITFNADSTLSGVGINVTGGTWTINYSGQLVTYGSSKGTTTFTLISGDTTNGWTGISTYSGGSAATTGTLVPAASAGFTDSMISGKSFSTGSGTITFNADGTLSGVGINVTGGTWTINFAGQLVTYGSSKGTATFTLISGDTTNGWTGISTYSGGSAATTGTLVPVATAGFTNSMISGKSFSTGSGIITFNADGTLSGAGTNLTGGTWTINPSGQLVTNDPSKGTIKFTLISGDATNGWTGISTYSGSSAATTGTLVPVATAYFTNSMLAGKTVTSPNGAYVDTDVFNANGTFTETRTNPNSPGVNSGTWSINSTGQLILTTTASQYQTLNVPTTLTLTSATSTALTMSANNTLYVLTYK